MNTKNNTLPLVPQTITNQALGYEVRTLCDDDGKLWFVAIDIAKALGYRDSPAMLRNLDQGRPVTQTLSVRSKSGVQQNRAVRLIDEAGLYEVIFASTKREAKAFKLWVLQDVLPSIRKHGGYMVGQEQFSDDFIHATFEHLNDITRRALNHYDRLTERTHFTAFRNKAAAQAECERAMVETAEQFGLSLKMSEIITAGKARRRAV